MRSDSEMVNLRSVIETLCYMVGEDSDGVEEVMQLPTIDLVHCGECIHFTKLGDGWGLCNAYNKTTQTIDFCSYGCRKESE